MMFLVGECCVVKIKPCRRFWFCQWMEYRRGSSDNVLTRGRYTSVGSMRRPGTALGRFVMHDDFGAGGCHRCFVEVKWAKEMAVGTHLWM